MEPHLPSDPARAALAFGRSPEVSRRPVDAPRKIALDVIREIDSKRGVDVAADLERRVAKLEAAYASVLAANESLTARAEQYRSLYMELLERYALLERGIVAGKKAERFTESSRSRG